MNEHQSIWKYLFKVPHTLQWVDVEGVQTRYLEAGKADAPVVIMLHGASGSLEYFCANIAEHARHFRVIAVDLMGSGLTDKPDHPYTPKVYREHIVSFMDALRIEKASFIGVALGSAISAHIAHYFPNRVTSFIMVSPGAIVTNEEDVEKFISGVKEKRAKASTELNWENVENIVSGFFYNPQKSLIDDLVSVRLESYRSGEIKKNMSNMLSSAQAEQFLSHEQWKKLVTPKLVIAPISIQHMFLDNARLIHKISPNTQLFEISECRIWAQYEQPAIFNSGSIEFIKGTL